MTSVRTAKSKGSQFELDCEASLKQLFPDIKRLGGQGQYREIDLESETGKITFECKRLKAISWNKAIEFYDKLQSRTPIGWNCCLLFQSNRQPCLVMNVIKFSDDQNPGIQYQYIITDFNNFFKVPFKSHKFFKLNNEVNKNGASD